MGRGFDSQTAGINLQIRQTRQQDRIESRVRTKLSWLEATVVVDLLSVELREGVNRGMLWAGIGGDVQTNQLTAISEAADCPS